MTREADTTKKPALLERIVDYLVDKPLSGLTFRGLAAALGVSSFTLVYHFGTRDDLVRDIIGAIATRQHGFETVFDPDTVTIGSYASGLRQTFESTLTERSRALQRLEFEAQMLEAVAPGNTVTKIAQDELNSQARITLEALGLGPLDAEIEAQLLLDTFYGIQVRLVVSNDIVRATSAFDRALSDHISQIERLLAA
jgi:AcrR family transcriptional regulator